MPSGADGLKDALSRLSCDPSYSAYVAVANTLHAVTPEASKLQPLKIAITRNFTIDAMVPVLEGELARAGFYPSMYLGEYDGVSQDLLDPRSALYRFEPDFIVIAQWLESLAPQFATRFLSFSAVEVAAEVDRLLGEIRARISVARQHSRSAILLNNFVLPPYPAVGILDAQSDKFQTGNILRLNNGLRHIASEFADVYVVDLMGLSARIGFEQAFDERYWHIGRAPLSRIALSAMAREYVTFIRALRGQTRKCLVLDCDNTLWGGVIGEDGIAGIKLGGTYPGSCYETFQRQIMNLKDRGVILALCSKNNEEDVREVLRNHPEMLLREEHFATWQINWNDKVTNLREIAQRLNIGLDAIVFADDSRFECDFVRESLPEVEVLYLGDEPSAFARLLASAGYFDSLTFSREDSVRTQMYRADSERQELQESAGSLSEYLARLQMVATIGKADELTIPRIGQLMQKTNQFNLTTRRYSEGEIRTLAAGRADIFYMKLRDRISDLGLVGVAILKYESSHAQIDTFLLSCRVLGRGAEEILLGQCLKSAAAAGVDRVSASYRRTSKNSQVADFYSGCGFAKVSETPEESVFEFHLTQNSFHPSDWIQVETIPCKESYAVQRS
jgi:FkbH-like protein